jgi:hypothetical protein
LTQTLSAATSPMTAAMTTSVQGTQVRHAIRLDACSAGWLAA